MKHFAVIGNPIEHSLSPQIHHIFAEQTGVTIQYDKIKTTEDKFSEAILDFFKDPNGKGLNITLPFKERAYTLAKTHTPRCIKAGAANTLWMHQDQLVADNTDGVGFIRDVSQHIEIQHKKVLLLGAGGATRGILGELFKANPASVMLSNRTMSKAQTIKEKFPKLLLSALETLSHEYDIIINATSSSLNDTALPLSGSILANHPFCYDLSYSLKHPTSFVRWAKHYGAPAIDGLGMLIEQAAEAFYIWHGVMPDTKPVKQLLFENLLDT